MNRRNLVIALALGALYASVPSYGAEPETVKIGFAGPLTGPVARVGKDLQYGAQLALDEENAKHPVIDGKPVKFVLDVQDDQADPRHRTGQRSGKADLDGFGLGAIRGHAPGRAKTCR
jgi:branched-chain amino acid transport system substrate-binding protein